MNPADVLDRERPDVLDVPLHQPFEPVAHAEDVDSIEPCADRCCSDDAIDAWRGTAADKDCESLMTFHVPSLYIIPAVMPALVSKNGTSCRKARARPTR